MDGLPSLETTVNSVKFPFKRDETRFEPFLHRRRKDAPRQSAGLPCDYSHQCVFLPLRRLFMYPNPRGPSSFMDLSEPLCEECERYCILLRHIVLAGSNVDREALCSESHRGRGHIVARATEV